MLCRALAALQLSRSNPNTSGNRAENPDGPETRDSTSQSCSHKPTEFPQGLGAAPWDAHRESETSVTYEHESLRI